MLYLGCLPPQQQNKDNLGVEQAKGKHHQPLIVFEIAGEQENEEEDGNNDKG